MVPVGRRTVLPLCGHFFEATFEINASKLLLAVMLAAPAIRLIYVMTGANGVALEWHFESVADGLAAGCLLAINQKKLHANLFYMRLCTSKWSLLLLPCVTIAAAWQGSTVLYELFGKSLIFLSATLFLDASIQQCRSLPGRVLNSSPLVSVGRWSSSLYLWQQVFLLEPQGTKPYAHFPLNLALALLVAVSSYYLLEQPIIRCGRVLLERHLRRSSQASPACGSPARKVNKSYFRGTIQANGQTHGADPHIRVKSETAHFA